MTTTFPVDPEEIQFQAIRAQGAGGQNVNKVSTALHLRFDIKASSLPEVIKQRLLGSKDGRINNDGVIVIKAQQYRTQEKNREDGIMRLQALVDSVAVTRKARRPTRPGRAAQRKRLDRKTRHGQLKKSRGRVSVD